MPDLVLDLQALKTETMADFSVNYSIVAELDNPYSQDLQAKLVRYNSRPGSPDIDADQVIDSLQSV